MSDFPFETVVRKAYAITDMGHDVYQKFTCARCRRRLTMATPNVFHETGTCDNCGAVTDIRRQGCNYMVEVHRRRDDLPAKRSALR